MRHISEYKKVAPSHFFYLSLMEILDGKLLSKNIKEELKHEVNVLVSEGKRAPHLAAILVGNDGASETYVNHKVKMCNDVGFGSTLLRLDDNISEEFLLEQVERLNKDDEIDGFIVQLPLPAHINARKVTLAIEPKKDVDGFHPVNMGRMLLGHPAYLPATPYGIMQLLRAYEVDTSGKDCVIVGRSNIVGKPMSVLMARNHKYGNCTVTLCHSKTNDLELKLKNADIIIAALGKPEFINADMVKDNAIIIDVGITRIPDESRKSGYRLAGDVNYADVAEKCSYITPVPGGVGPMTVISLMKNTMKAYKKQVYKS